jgi:hypothetical protein
LGPDLRGRQIDEPLLVSTPISAMITSAVRRFTPGMVSKRSTSSVNGAMATSICALTVSIPSSSAVEVRQDLGDKKAVMLPEAATQGLPQGGKFLAQRPASQVGQDSASVVPWTSASSMARPETPRMSVATDADVTPASSSTLWRRFAARVRSWINDFRWRVRSRSSRIDAGGTKVPRISPCSSSCAIQTQSSRLSCGLALARSVRR